MPGSAWFVGGIPAQESRLLVCSESDFRWIEVTRHTSPIAAPPFDQLGIQVAKSALRPEPRRFAVVAELLYASPVVEVNELFMPPSLFCCRLFS